MEFPAIEHHMPVALAIMDEPLVVERGDSHTGSIIGFDGRQKKSLLSRKATIIFLSRGRITETSNCRAVVDVGP